MYLDIPQHGIELEKVVGFFGGDDLHFHSTLASVKKNNFFSINMIEQNNLDVI